MRALVIGLFLAKLNIMNFPMSLRWLNRCLFSSFLALMTVFVTSAAFADTLSCTDLFRRQDINRPLTPQEVTQILKKAGIKEEIERQIEIPNAYFSFFQSPLAKKLKAFHVRWRVPIYYSNDPTIKNLYAWTSTGRSTTVDALYFPIQFFRDQQRVITLLEQIDRLMQHSERVTELGAMSRLDILDLTLYISGSSPLNPPQDAFLRWISKRVGRHKLSFEIRENDQVLTDAAGYASDDKVVLRSDYLSPSPAQWLTPRGQSVLAHEIVHATNAAKFKKYGANAEKLIYFYSASDRPLHSTAIYTQWFRSDELDARVIQAPWASSPEAKLEEAKTFLVQKQWLTEALNRVNKRLILAEPISMRPTVTVSGHQYFNISISIDGWELEVLVPYNQLSLGTRDSGSVQDRLEYIKDILQKRLQQLNNIEQIHFAE